MDIKKIANPGPLGLLGFGMTTVLLNLENAGIIHLSMVIIAMGICLGGLAQLIAGIFEFKNGNTFAGTAFVSYGTFWFSLVLIWCGKFGPAPVDSLSMGFYLLMWCLYTGVMFIGTLKHNRATQVVFGTLTLLFLLLALGKFTEVTLITKIAGVLGIICGLSAVYNASAQILNAEYGKVILPVGDKHE